MPMKTCPKCGKQSGPRTKKCECGHEFIPEKTPNPASASISVTASNEIMKVESPKHTDKISVQGAGAPPVQENVPVVRNMGNLFNGQIIAPAGPCPRTPKGYKRGWPDGPASDEVVQNWAVDVYNSGDGKYSWEAVRYWAREFWDINSKEFPSICNLIASALNPSSVALN